MPIRRAMTPTEIDYEAACRRAGLDVKWHREPGAPPRASGLSQLEEMLAAHLAKRDRLAGRHEQALDDDGLAAVRWRLRRQGLAGEELAERVERWKRRAIRKQLDLDFAVGLIEVEIRLREEGLVEREPIGTTYYIDADSGNNGNAGTSTGAAWASLDQFTENARSAGDRAILRRGTTNRYDNGSHLLFTSDGTPGNPIVIEADYDDAFGDQVDLSATATATLTVGSKAVTFSADVSGVLAAGDWIYALGDDARLFAYEVAAVAGANVTLYLPYKGGQAGAGRTMFNMQSAPAWNTAAGNFSVNFDADNCWLVRGVIFRGTDANGVVEIDTSSGHQFEDCVFEGNGFGDFGLACPDDQAAVILRKCRIYNCGAGIHSLGGSGAFWLEARDCLFDGNNVTSSKGTDADTWANETYIECEFVNHASADLAPALASASSLTLLTARNCVLGSTTPLSGIAGVTAQKGGVFFQDYDGSPGDTRQVTYLSSANTTPILQSSTSKLRTGGAAESIKVTPSADLGGGWYWGSALLFELPIYLPASAATIEVFFASDNISEWTANPTAAELWLELEFWGHATNNYRRIVRSSGTLDFTTDTDFDQALSVSATPAQAGIAFLRAWYAKPKESTKANIFYVDPVPVIS